LLQVEVLGICLVRLGVRPAVVQVVYFKVMQALHLARLTL
jgi:hypothetical protein